MKKLLLSLVSLLLLISCGGSNSNSGAEKGGAEKVVSMNISEEPGALDPQLLTDQEGMKINELVFEGLTKIGSDSKIEPGIAESWETSADGLVWTFKLRDAKWSNGEPVVAEDFKTAWTRALDPQTASQYSYMLYSIKGAEAYNTEKGSVDDLGIEVVDDKTLKVTLERKTPYFDSLVAFPTLYPVNKAFLDEQGADYGLEAEAFLFNGPYKITSWTHDSEIVLEKNEAYWNPTSVKVDKIIAKMIPDANAALNAFKNNELDIVRLEGDQLQEFKGDERVTGYSDGSVWYMEFNTTNEVLSNVKIRKALQESVNSEKLVNEIINNGSEVATGLVPKGFIGKKGDYREENGVVFPGYNVEDAKKLLAEGLKELGLTELPPLTIITNDSGINKQVAEYLQEEINKNLGINVEIELTTFKIRLQKMEQKDFDIVLAGWGPDYQDPMTYMDLWLTNGGNNHTSWSNAKYDELIKKAQMSVDNNERMQAMQDAEKILGQEVPIAMLYFRYRNALVNPRVKGVKFKAVGSEFYLRDIDVAE